jgi:hydroxymethylpyrimidine/phosphomethylpyrimidine kinase
MGTTKDKKPVVLVLAGHDPCGGAGIQADIEAIAANGCHAATVITCLTSQNTSEFRQAITVNADYFSQQLEMILADMPVSACKIGLIADMGILSAIEKTLIDLMDIPVVLDPVISAGTGTKIVTDDIRTSLRDKLLPFITVITPNTTEARAITGTDNPDEAAAGLLARGCRAALITGTHEPTDKVINTLYLQGQPPIQNTWERLPGSYHGSGCTLSSCIAAMLAHGKTIGESAAMAQKYTWQTLKQGMLLGKGQFHPDRFYRK